MINKEQLMEILELNKEVHQEISLIAEKDYEEFQQEGIHITEAVAFTMEQKCRLIKYPLQDCNIGGFIHKKNGRAYCYINTLQDRAFQNFVFCHEYYHLKYSDSKFDMVSGKIENETSINERKANYYASLIMLNKNSLRNNFYYYTKDKGYDLLTTVCFLMNLYKTTYKTILIRLFELGCIEEFSILYNNFEVEKQVLTKRFESLGLDKSMIEPSCVVAFGAIEDEFKKAFETKSMLSDFLSLNKERYEEIKKELKAIESDIGEKS